MKKTILVIAALLFIAGCGVPQQDYDDLEKEIGILENQLDAMAMEKIALEKANAELTEENLRYHDMTRELSVERTALDERVKMLEADLEKSRKSLVEAVNPVADDETSPSEIE